MLGQDVMKVSGYKNSCHIRYTQDNCKRLWARLSSRSRSYLLTRQLTRICKASFCIMENKLKTGCGLYNRQCCCDQSSHGLEKAAVPYKEMGCELACRDLKGKWNVCDGFY